MHSAHHWHPFHGKIDDFADIFIVDAGNDRHRQNHAQFQLAADVDGPTLPLAKLPVANLSGYVILRPVELQKYAG